MSRVWTIVANPDHTCAALKTLESHFVDRDPRVRATHDAIVEALKSIGPVTVLPEKTRIALQVRMSFAALMPRKRWLDGHLVLARLIDSPRFRRIETFSPRNILHGFVSNRPTRSIRNSSAGWKGPTRSVSNAICKLGLRRIDHQLGVVADPRFASRESRGKLLEGGACFAPRRGNFHRQTAIGALSHRRQ